MARSEDTREQASPWLSGETWERLQEDVGTTTPARLTTFYDPDFGAIAQLTTADGQLFFGADGTQGRA